MKNIKVKDTLINKNNKEWGEFVVLKEYDNGIWEIRGNSGVRLLYEDELKFWDKIIK